MQNILGNWSCTGIGECRLWILLRRSSLSTEKPAPPPKPPGGTMHAFTSSQGDCDSRTQESPRNPENPNKETQSRPADLLTTTAVPGRSAALDVCVASSNAAAARGDAQERNWKNTQDAVNWVILARAQEKGLRFWQIASKKCLLKGERT